MAWKPIDFQGIVSLDTPLIHELTLYLDEKEFQLSQVITHAIPSLSKESNSHSITLDIPGTRQRLSDAVEILDKNIRELSLKKDISLPSTDWKRVRDELNAAIWTFVENIESCVIELFQQLGQVGLEYWRTALLESVNSVKVLLMQRLEDCIWIVRRLESLLRQYRKMCLAKERSFLDIRWPWQWILDQGIVANLQKSQKFLMFRYQRFVGRFNKYIKLHGKSEESLQKFDQYPTLRAMEGEKQEKYKRIYQLLKLWEVNKISRSLPKQEIVRTLRNLISPERTHFLFQEYFLNLKNQLFKYSLQIKQDTDTPLESYSQEILKKIEINRAETHTLGATIAKYRDFLLRTDPNPYVRARWGFSEWIVGPEPRQTKSLLDLGYEVEHLDHLYVNLHQSISKGKTYLETMKIGEHNNEILHWIHEMGQPLTSLSMMKSYVDKILTRLKELNELGSFNSFIVEFTGDMLAKTMRVDWKYHVLFENPLFQELYLIHKGIVGPIEDRQHLNRLIKFNQLINQVQDWVKKNTIARHSQEIEQEMNDLKEYLQDYYAYVQRVTSDENLSPGQAKGLINELSEQLIEYRFLFGKFFHDLRYNETEERSLRNQFLFVDQYFESVDNKIYALKKTSDSRLQG